MVDHDAEEEHVEEAGCDGGDGAEANASPESGARIGWKDAAQTVCADGAGEVAVGAIELALDASATEDAVIQSDGFCAIFSALEVESVQGHRERRLAEITVV